MIAAATESNMRAEKDGRQLYAMQVNNGKADPAKDGAIEFYNALGLKQDRLAFMLGVSQQRVSAIQTTGTGPALHVIRAVLAAGLRGAHAIAVLQATLAHSLMSAETPALEDRFREEAAEVQERFADVQTAIAALIWTRTPEAFRTLSTALVLLSGASTSLAATAKELSYRKLTENR